MFLKARDSPFDSGFAVPQTISCPKIWADFLCDIHVTHEEKIPDGPPRMVKRPTGSGGEPSSPNCGASAGGKARQLLLTNRWFSSTWSGPPAQDDDLQHSRLASNPEPQGGSWDPACSRCQAIETRLSTSRAGQSGFGSPAGSRSHRQACAQAVSRLARSNTA